MDGQRVISAGDDGTVRSFTTATGQPAGTFDGAALPVRGLALSPDGRFVAAGGDDRTLFVWELASRQRVLTVQLGAAIRTVDWRAGRVLVGGAAGLVVLDVK